MKAYKIRLVIDINIEATNDQEAYNKSIQELPEGIIIVDKMLISKKEI